MNDDKRWQFSVEGYDPRSEAGIEAVLCVGNGFAGVRGGLEEGPRESIPRTFIAGLFDRPFHGQGPPPNLAAAPQLLTAPDWLAFDLQVDGERIHIEAGEANALLRALDLRGGLLRRQWHHRSLSGRETSVTVVRCAHLDDRQALLERVIVRPENHSGHITLELALDGRAMRSRDDGPRLGTHVERGRSPMVLIGRAPHGPVALTMAQRTRLQRDAGASGFEPVCTQSARGGNIVHRWEWNAEANHAYTLDRFVACQRSLHGPPPVLKAKSHARVLERRGMETLLEEHQRSWQTRWHDADVQIDGESDAQRAVRWALYQLISAADPTDDRVSIGARGLTGLSYHGHVFWDTEIYLLPFYVFTWPAAARTLLMYRYHTLPAARARAASLGYRGALYAWESALSGTDVTPAEVVGADGRPAQIYTGRQAHHVSADVAYAVQQYLLASGDEGFFLEAGAEILIETARFWQSRVDGGENAGERSGGIRIRCVIGPDEYHDSVDDDAYTLAMARYNLEAAVKAEARLAACYPSQWQKLRAQIGLDAHEPARWRQLAERLEPLRRDDGALEEFRGYFGLEDLDLGKVRSAHPDAPAVDVALGRERVQQTQFVKQADVVLLCALLEDRFSHEQILRSFQWYEPRCDHSSSLSPGMHGLVAARLNLADAARRYFEQTAYLDLRAHCNPASDGVHLANCGALWQELVFGVAGMRLQENGLAFAPHLLAGWEALRFAVQWHGSRLEAEVTADAGGVMRLTNAGPGVIPVQIGGAERRNLAPGETLRCAVKRGG